MSTDAAVPRRVAVVVGLPLGVRNLLEQRFRGHVTIRSITLRQDGGFRLEPPPAVAVRLLEQFAEEATSYADLVVVVLPYAAIPQEVSDTAALLQELEATLIYGQPGSSLWPSRSPRLDKRFQDQLLDAVVKAIDTAFPEPKAEDPDEEIASELVRGLASHSKMGPNNHSHEDDLWKSRGKKLGPAGRRRIIAGLLTSGILGRKKNDSAGGKGWVYWIDDVARAKEIYPGLVKYLE